MEKMTQHQLGQIKEKLSKLSQKFELVAAGFILRFIRNLKIAPTIILSSLLITYYSLLLCLFAIRSLYDNWSHFFTGLIAIEILPFSPYALILIV